MADLSQSIQAKMKYIDELITKTENYDAPSIYSILRNEIDLLKSQIAELKASNEDKKVVGKEEKASKTRYYLKDGSVYVVKGREYRYLYDAKSKVVTYEFENGQIERTFDHGLKEIRRRDGTIVIKTGPRDFDYIQ